MKTTKSALAAGIALAVTATMLSVAVEAPAYASVTCSYSYGDGNSLGPFEYAGHYSGTTTVPSSTTVSTAGEEAQCLLKLLASTGATQYDPGPLDGIFGRQSQTAARNFQEWMDASYNANLDMDGIVGSATWPWLRHWAYLWDVSF